MGFNSNFSGSFRTFGNKVKRVVLAPFDMAFRRFKQKTAVNTVFNKISEDVRSEVKSITKKPESQKEYFVFGDRYVAKKIVYVAGILLMFFIIFMINKGYPAIVEKWFTKTMIVNDIEVADYSGRVRLLSERDRETVLFVGKLTEGAIEGNGTLYDYDGNLVYKGSFTDGLYEGEGVMYYPNGNAKYRGSFSKNKFDGDGVFYDEDKNVLYEGEFAQGEYNGTGKLYYSTGETEYRGSFVDGKYEGEGVLYDRNGDVVYEGEFSRGMKNGAGKGYRDGVLVYDGTFRDDEFMTGYACLYDSNGKKLYDGQLEDGEYSGMGKLYKNGLLLYDGSFANGLYEGEGKLYDKEGRILYEGTLAAGEYEGKGKLYCEGEVIYEGDFVAGEYSGEGKEYDWNGNLVYTGGFLENEHSGEGKVYNEEGTLIYDGGFVEGKYSGEGKLFDEDTGVLIYEGGFYNGLYDGEGKIYNPENSKLVYEGGLREGLYDGYGTLYDTAGFLFYEGNFSLGLYNGEGANYYYDGAGGIIRREGIFVDGEYEASKSNITDLNADGTTTKNADGNEDTDENADTDATEGEGEQESEGEGEGEGDAQPPEQASGAKPIIIDTDFASDADDILALRLAMCFQDLGMVDIKGIALSTVYSRAPLAVHALCKYDGYGDIPVAMDTSGRSVQVETKYVDVMCDWPRSRNDYEVPVKMYRRMLAESSEKVNIITLGFLQNIQDLLESAPDEYSQLNGMDLVKEKVEAIYIVGGSDSGSPSFNFYWTGSRVINAAQMVTTNCPVKTIYLSSDLTGDTFCGQFYQTEDSGEKDIVTKALKVNGQGNGLIAWDVFSMWCAIQYMTGNSETYSLGFEPGNWYVSQTGATQWQKESATGGGRITKGLRGRDYSDYLNSMLHKKFEDSKK